MGGRVAAFNVPSHPKGEGEIDNFPKAMRRQLGLSPRAQILIEPLSEGVEQASRAKQG